MNWARLNVVPQSAALALAVSLLFLPSARTDVASQTGTPGVSGVSGSVGHNGIVTITGSNFGTKPTGAPWKWDNMDGANGARLEPRGWLVHQNNPQPVLSNARVRGTPGATAAVRLTQTAGDVPLFGFGNNDGGYLSLTAASAANYRPFPVPAWIDYWMYFHPPTGSNNYKFWRHHGNNSSGSPNGFWSMPGNGGVTSCSSFDWSSMSAMSQGSNPSLTCPIIRDKWVHVQMMFRTDSAGLFFMWVDGVQYFSVSNYVFDQSGTQRANFMIESQQLTTTGDGEMYIDDFYVDQTFARVEIGDSPVYSSSRHRETQIPSSWSNNSLSVQLNQGSFSSFSGLYLYVINAQGVASPGYCLNSCSGTAPAPVPAPTAPTNVRVIR